MDACCSPPSHLARDARRRRVLWLVLAVNAVMFAVELTAGLVAGSVALQADSLDMLGDALVYGFSLAVVGRAVRWQARAAQLKGAVMLVFGLGVLAQAVAKALWGASPNPAIVSGIGALALAANAACAVLLFGHRGDDINMRSTWICSRNDVLANASVIAAGAGVAVSGSAWPDIVVSLGIVALFLRSAAGVLGDAHAALAALPRRVAGLRCANGCCPATACHCPAP